MLCAWNNVVVTRLPGYPGSYVAANVAATGVLLVMARVTGLSWQELGLARHRLRAGLGWGQPAPPWSRAATRWRSPFPVSAHCSTTPG
ncbi:hypothetical protein [Blastococcus brunescens]|uniref:Uncharacterized protein n=1 Tax=Blastococcus brunescens TaxID=1564165 RepID=A0ABZ1B6Y6_9ACTN|nr:hypothetical protein [Blastococcus sp. BMG 8361]WRL66564.1 hypothetical protein U6N30_14880 [Blastococcus sp. BMG 8361]